MQLTPEQVKRRIKNVAKENKADARRFMRIYMMERFLERVASSQYKDNFIIKQVEKLKPTYEESEAYQPIFEERRPSEEDAEEKHQQALRETKENDKSRSR